MPSKARAAATVTAAEAWEECLARRGLAERPGRLELQAPQKQKPDLQEVLLPCAVVFAGAQPVQATAEVPSQGAVASRSFCAWISNLCAEAKEGRSSFEGPGPGVQRGVSLTKAQTGNRKGAGVDGVAVAGRPSPLDVSRTATLCKELGLKCQPDRAGVLKDRAS